MSSKPNAINCLKLGIVASVITLVFFSFQKRSWVHQWMEPNRPDRPLRITDQSFQHEVVNVDGPILVVFQAPWCQTCKAMKSTIEKVADIYFGRMKVVSINGDENEFARQKYKVDRYPTLVFFYQGEEVHRLVGLISASDLMSSIDASLRNIQVSTF